MALVTWDASYSVNVKRCDVEHQKLFYLINTLFEAMNAGRAHAIIASILRELGKYTRSHFCTEEALMERANYPTLSAHRTEHLKFVAQIEQYQKDLEAGSGGDPVVVLEFLKDWLEQHIKQTDKMYIRNFSMPTGLTDGLPRLQLIHLLHRAR